MHRMVGAAKNLALFALLSYALSAYADELNKSPVVEPPAPTSYGPFTMDDKLEPRVHFWVDIYTKYNTWDTLIVDIKHPQLIFSATDTRKRWISVATEKRRITTMISHLAAKWEQIQSGKLKRNKLSASEESMMRMLEKEKLTSVLREIAGDPSRLRTQNGLKDALEDSLFVSGRYLPRMEALFVRFKLPPEIAYLPFVESGFNKRAISKVGASGIWQFMPYTGKLFLRVDEVVDERNDPMRAAEAAARLMKQNFDVLGDWPLAITAYNHGTTGVAKAARDVGSRQISEIIQKFENKNFGFASQNFYACFLAALHVAKNSEAYLGSLPRAKRLEFDEFVMPDYMSFRDFVGKMGIDETVFRELNPALTEEVYSGRKFIPVGYNVRVPVEASAGFLGRYETLPGALKFRSQKAEGQEEDRMPASVETGSVGSDSMGGIAHNP